MAISLKPLSDKKWDSGKAQHLLNRAGFGVPRERANHLASLSLEKAVDYIVHYDQFPEQHSDPDFLVDPKVYAALRELEYEERTKKRNEIRRKERQAINLLQQWWMDRMLNTTRPLEEKLTLFWHGHFAVSAQKIQVSKHNHELNSIFRRHASGNFKTLTTAVGKTPAMLRYLDNNQNRKGRPNENWARELMELFTIGIGNYTEEDIKESARSFTGWTTNRTGSFVFAKRQHDDGSKTFMGKQGNFDGYDIIDIIFEQEATSRFIVQKLWSFFAYGDPEPEIIDELASTFRSTGYEIKPVMKKMFLSNAFYSDKAIGTQIKSPAQFVVMLAHDMDLTPPPYQSMARSSAQLGQNLFYPPNVKGWDGGRAWINANTLLSRYNLPTTLSKANGVREERMMAITAANMDDMAMDSKGMQQKVQDQFLKHMETRTPQQQKQIRTRLNKAKNPRQRQNMVQYMLDTAQGYTPWKSKEVFSELSFNTAGECIDQLEAIFLSSPLNKEQRTVLLAGLGESIREKDVLKLNSLTEEKMNATLHLLLSTAEYQLC
jgi:uncharacterized protein (DUF1800 family)